MGKYQLPLLVHESYEFVPPDDEGIEHIAANLRPVDQEEMYATFGHRRYLDGIRLSMAGADSVVMAISAFSEPVAVLGVNTVSFLYNTGCPWMLATPHVDRYRRAFIECGRSYTQSMLSEYESLENHVDERNVKSIAWLRRIGFQIDPPEPYGALGYPFHPFRMTR